LASLTKAGEGGTITSSSAVKIANGPALNAYEANPDSWVET
jgi:hypothetical protein